MEAKIFLTSNSLLYGEQSEILFDLYLPIISYKSLFLYEYFCNLIKNGIKEISVEDVSKYTNFNNQDFLLSRRTLESIGLIKTYKKGATDFLIILSSPKTPAEFLSDDLLRTLLFSRVDENYQNFINSKYIEEKIDTKGLENISANFQDSFHVEYVGGKDNSKKYIGVNSNDINVSFDEKKFFDYLNKHSRISKSMLSQDELDEIIRLENLYGIEITEYADMVRDAYKSNNFGERIDFSYLKNRIRLSISTTRKFTPKNNKKTKIDSETELANKIKHYEETSPRVFLKEKQGGIEASQADLNLIDSLSKHYQFGNGVINCLLDYIIETKNGQLNKNYVDKIAANMVRAKVQTTLDAINYFSSESKGVTSKSSSTENKTSTVQSVNNYDNDLFDESELDEEALWRK